MKLSGNVLKSGTEKSKGSGFLLKGRKEKT